MKPLYTIPKQSGNGLTASQTALLNGLLEHGDIINTARSRRPNPSITWPDQPIHPTMFPVARFMNGEQIPFEPIGDAERLAKQVETRRTWRGILGILILLAGSTALILVIAKSVHLHIGG
jgi:hypothetical protein